MSGNSRSAKNSFLDALELEASERQVLLAGIEGSLQERVRDLLAAHQALEQQESASGTWLTPLTELPAISEPQQDELRPGARIGPFLLIEEIGSGAFGRVWLVEQSEPVKRRVALKTLKAGLNSQEITTRFHAERQALALMSHPSIARIFDGGTSASGLPWFAMEYVDGEPITEYCQSRKLPLRSRLELFLGVCRAVQHAHQRGVIHRDIKPNNVLVTEIDGTATPKVIDFGIAKAIEQSLTLDGLQTRGGQVMGTPAWMSPEQIGDAGHVDTRADIYSLGALLYQLLTEQQVSANPDGEVPGMLELLELVKHDDPPKPSARATRRQAVSAPRARDLRGDLDWISMRCLEKDKERRYGSVASLASDIERHLAGDTVSAGPPTMSYRLSKLTRRYRVALAFAAVVILLLVAGVVVATSQARRELAAEVNASEEARKARVELERYEGIATLLEHVLMSIDPLQAQGKDTELMLQVLERAVKRVENQQPLPGVEATVRRVVGGAYVSIARYDEAEVQLQRALDIRLELFTDNHEDTLVLLEELGGLHMNAGRPLVALPLIDRA
ncbi:MAG: serine/threonine protein kinase [Candidatus Paceibacteria bacterium]|jgi:serine/threonine protein kinase